MTKFKNINNGEVVSVLNQVDNFYILNSGKKMDINLFLQSFVPIEVEQPQTPTQTTHTQSINENSHINPDDFFAPKKLVDGEALKNFNTNNMVDVPKNQQTTVKNYESDDIDSQEHNQLLEQRKQQLIQEYNSSPNKQTQPIQSGYGSQAVDPNDDAAIDALINQNVAPKPVKDVDENGLTKQQEFMRQQQLELTGVDPFKDKIEEYRTKNPTQQRQQIQTNTQQTNTQTNQNNNQQFHNEVESDIIEDDVIKMYRKFKRNSNITISLKVKDKIGKPDFIKMMADGLDGDIIQFYTDEIMNIYLSDTDSIKKEVYNQIYKHVYGELPEEVIIEENIIEEVRIEKEKEIKEGDEITLIPGKKTAAGKQKYKFINKKGNVVELLIKSATDKGYIPATEKDIK
jgi:hypothetical protein